MPDPARGDSGLERALVVWGRRKWLALLAFALAITAAASFVRFLPDLYRASATVLVERPQVPETFVRTAVTGEVETRLNTISQEILSRARLEDLIARFDLYPALRKRTFPEAVVERMRRDIQLEVKRAEQPGGAGTATAFTLSYWGRDPHTVARVTNTLASFFVQQNLTLRERQAAGTAEFLKGQLAEMRKKLNEEERRVSEFKMRHTGELPQQVEANLATLERLNAQLRFNNESQIRAMERRDMLARQLAETNVGGHGPEPDPTAARIAKLNQELVELRTRFTDKYPDVIRMKAEMAALERQRAEGKDDGGPDAKTAAPADPVLRRLRESLSEAEAELKGLKAKDQGLREAIAAYERRVENSPRRGQEFQELSRDYETTKELYASLLKRYEDAQLAESLEQGRRGEQFRVLDPAIPPKEPTAPNRARLNLIVLVLSLGIAAGAMALAEQLDTSFHTVDELRAFSKLPVLVSIPRIATESDMSRRRRRFRLAAASAALGLALMVGASYVVAHGNEQLVWMMVRKGS